MPDNSAAGNLKRRIGVDINQKLGLEEALDWAARHKISYIDLCIDTDPSLLAGDAARERAARTLMEREGIALGLHTLSAVNIAEMSPHVADAADEYLAAYIKASKRLGAGWIVVHGGYHFTADKTKRMEASLARLQRAAAWAERDGALLLLENLNPEPDQAEVQYLAHDIEECRYFFDRIQSPALQWSYTVNHAHMTSDGIAGFVEALDVSRCREVRVADNRGEVEEHLFPGEGTIDFAAMFSLLEGRGFAGHYMQAYGSLDDMLRGRDILVRSTGV